MHFGVRQIAAVLSAVGLILFCSCEKHRLGEDPEIQKEHVNEANGGGDNAAPLKETGLPKPTAPSHTPAEFFPKSSPTP